MEQGIRARTRTTRVGGHGVTPVRHRTPSSLLAPAPHTRTPTTTVRLSDRPRARSNAVSAPPVALRAERATAGGETTSPTVTRLAKLAARLASAVSSSAGGARKSKLALTLYTIKSGCAVSSFHFRGIASEYMGVLDMVHSFCFSSIASEYSF